MQKTIAIVHPNRSPVIVDYFENNFKIPSNEDEEIDVAVMITKDISRFDWRIVQLQNSDLLTMEKFRAKNIPVFISVGEPENCEFRRVAYDMGTNKYSLIQHIASLGDIRRYVYGIKTTVRKHTGELVKTHGFGNKPYLALYKR